MEIHKAGILETELARREVMRNLKVIKEYVGSCWHDAHNAREYSREDAEDAFRRIDIIIERQAGKWLWPDEENKSWHEV